MLQEIIALDKTLFDLIHNQWTSSLLDMLMPGITDLHRIWWFKFILVPSILITWFFLSRKKALKHFFALILVVGATDLISHRLIKANVQRLRPRHHQDLNVHLKTRPHAGWSFTSNHAANNFAAATYLTLAYPVMWPTYFLAMTIAYSRTYVGVHFPLDVLGGATLGILLALILTFILRKTPWYRKH